MQDNVKGQIPGLVFIGNGLPLLERIPALLNESPMFDGFEREDIVRLAPYLKTYRAPAGTEIIREGDEGSFMLLPVTGMVEIFKRDAGGEPRSIGFAGPGKTLGEMSMLDGELRSASCLAREDTLLAMLDRNDLIRIVAEDPGLGVKILISLVQLLSKRLRDANSKLVGAIDV